MNCCNANGDCTRGHDCPARTGTVLPHQVRHVGKVARVKATRPADIPEPVESYQPLSYDETMALVRTLLLWLLAATCTVAVVSMAVGYGTERFSDVLWSYLAGVS